MTFLEILLAVIILLLLIVAYQLAAVKDMVAKIRRPPPVEFFYTLEGLLEHCRQHYPNCYQKLLLMRDNPHWQARLGYSKRMRFDSKKNGIPMYRYFDALQLLAKGKTKPIWRCGDLELLLYEKAFNEVRDDDEIYDAVEKHLPLPPDFEEDDND